MRNSNKFVLLAGLPRTGSTLLLNVLAQNKKFHIESNSGLCQLMWDMQTSCKINCSEQLLANNKLDSVSQNIIGSLPSLYYQDVSNKTIFDKCRPWASSSNIEMAKNYISKDIKAIVLVRPIDEIIKSIAKLHFDSGGNESIYEELMNEKSSWVMNSFFATLLAAQSKADNLLFLSYNNIVNDLKNVIDKIYDFTNENKINHNTTNIKTIIKEDESVYDYPEIHNVRSKVSKTPNNIVLPEWVKDQADSMTNILFEHLEIKLHPEVRAA